MSDETKVEKSTNVDGKSVSQPIAKPFVGCSVGCSDSDLSYYLLPYKIPDHLKTYIKDCIAIRNGDTGLSHKEAKEYIKNNYPKKVYAYLYGYDGNGGIATDSLLEMLN